MDKIRKQIRAVSSRSTLVVMIALLAVLAVTATACGGEESAETSETTEPKAAGPERLVLMTHDSFAVSDHVWASFKEQTGIDVEVLRAGDAGAMLNQAILTADNPVADVLFGVDNTFLSRALKADLFVPYASDLLQEVPESLQLDEENRVTPVDFGDVCLNYDKALIGGPGQPPVPTDLRDLTQPEYRSLLVVEDPATSSPGLAFLLATVATFGEEGDYTWRDYWADLRENDVLAVSGWEEAYYSHFSAAGDGDRPLVVSYASSPPAEVIFAEEALDEAPTGAVTAGAFRQIEFAGILRGTEKEEAARQLIDFMLSLEFQEDIPLNMFVFPANQEAELPPEFIEYTELAENPLTVDPETIEENRETWIEEWQEIVLR
ncbi:MAG: thiamine ABC transporter substrate-binding protein [Thermoleophilia bacterium]